MNADIWHLLDSLATKMTNFVYSANIETVTVTKLLILNEIADIFFCDPNVGPKSLISIIHIFNRKVMRFYWLKNDL